MIPKIIHQIWLGLPPPHPLMIGWRRRWRKLHPDWDLLIWREVGQELVSTSASYSPIQPSPGERDVLTRACNLAQRANIWRYLVLREHGGLYVDDDVEPLQPVDALVDTLAAFAGQRSDPSQLCECAFMGATPHHPWLDDLVRSMPLGNPHISLGLGCDYLTAITKKHPEVTKLPPETVVFQPPDDWERAKIDALVPDPVTTKYPQAFAVHHWGSLWHQRGFDQLPVVPHGSTIPSSRSSRCGELLEIAKKAGSPKRLRVLEWGSGLSTSVLVEEVARRDDGVVVTIDFHAAYQQQVLAGLPHSYLVHALAADLDGPLHHDRHPLAQERNYGTLPLGMEGPWDLIVIDGRRRLECALTASLVAYESTLIALHDYRRARYRPVVTFLDVVEDLPEYRLLRRKSETYPLPI